MKTSIAWIGYGYVAQAAIATLRVSEPDWGHTTIGRTADYRVDVQSADSVLPAIEAANPTHIVISCPAQHISSALWADLGKLPISIVLLGTTSIYDRSSTSTINEDTPVDSNHTRYADECAAQAAGIDIIRLSGIYGPNRNPSRWAISGRVKPEQRQVNFIHVNDIVNVLSSWIAGSLQQSQQSNPLLLNLADGQDHTWLEIFEWLFEHGHISTKPEVHPLSRPSAQISTEKLQQLLPSWQAISFFEALEKLLPELQG